MDQIQMGNFIRQRRLALGLTQEDLAKRLGISAKAVSKWECGRGAPDMENLSTLASALGVDVTSLLRGGRKEQEMQNGNLRKMKFYVCPHCGNLLLSAAEADMTCCSLKLSPLEPQKPDAEHPMDIAVSDGDWYLTSTHEMLREHYLSFAAFVSGDTVMVKKTYPEWDFGVRIPRICHGMFLWYCTEHGLFYTIK